MIGIEKREILKLKHVIGRVPEIRPRSAAGDAPKKIESRSMLAAAWRVVE